MILFFALCALALAIGGFSAFVIFWPLSLVHLRDRHPQVHEQLGVGAFLNPVALWWLLSRRYRTVADPSFTGLATPAWVSLVTILVGLALGGFLWVIGNALQ